MTDQRLHLKIRLVAPPTNYAFCLQRGKGAKAERLDYVEVLNGEDQCLEFELQVTVRPAKNRIEPDFFGPYVQGTFGARIFYLCVGAVVEVGDPKWSGRVKVPLVGLDWPLINEATKPSNFLYARYHASQPNGRPIFASVQLLDNGWTIKSDE